MALESNKRPENPASGSNRMKTLVVTDSPDDFPYEGNPTDVVSHAQAIAIEKHLRGDDADVTVDNPDDFET